MPTEESKVEALYLRLGFDSQKSVPKNKYFK